jgi:hypothetical protein
VLIKVEVLVHKFVDLKTRHFGEGLDLLAVDVIDAVYTVAVDDSDMVHGN